MKGLKQVMMAGLGGGLITLVILTFSFLMGLFRSGADGYRTIFFGSIFFEIITSAETGAVTLNFGLTGYFLPILITFCLAWGICFGCVRLMNNGH